MALCWIVSVCACVISTGRINAAYAPSLLLFACESPTVPHGSMFWSAILLLTLTAAAVRANSTATVLPVPSEKLVCSFLKQPLCRMAGYNQTAFPNQRQHETQEEATGEMADFSKLWTEGSSCSNAIVYFLCSYYFPFCVNVYGSKEERTTVPPCRNLCEAARSGCENVIEENTEVGWPTFLECSKFPEVGPSEGSSGLCFGPPDPSVLPSLTGELITEAPTTPSESPTTPVSGSTSPSQKTSIIISMLFVSFVLLFHVE